MKVQRIEINNEILKEDSETQRKINMTDSK